jgi:hypothetical protein
VTAVLDGLSAPAVGAGESQAVGLGALSLAMLAVSVDGTCSAWRCPHRPECCTRRSRTCNGSRRQVPVRLRERKMAKTLASMHGFCGNAKRRR